MVSKASEPQMSVRMRTGRNGEGGYGEVNRRATCKAAAARCRDASSRWPRPVCRCSVHFRRSAAAQAALSRPDVAHDELLAARHRQRLGDAVQQHLPVRVAVVVDAPLEAADEIARDEAVAVDAHEAVAELVLEPGQRFLEQVLALRRADRDVLELGLEVDDLVDRHQHDARALGHRQEAARRRRQLRRASRSAAGFSRGTFCSAPSSRCTRTGFTR